MKTTSVFSENIEAYTNGTRIIANKGSSRSSKTWSILQLLYIIAKHSRKKLRISIVSKTLPHVKAGVMSDFEEILIGEGIVPDLIHHKTEHYYKIGKSRIEYFGADNEDRVHGPKRDILFINEIPFVKYQIFEQLMLRTSGAIFLDYNPIGDFWFDTETMINDNPVIIHSTYLDNEFLEEGIRKFLDSRFERYNREKADGTITKSFENWCKVYLFGTKGSLEGLIYENWRYAEPGELEIAFSELGTNYALDYGFYPNPDAMSEIAIDRKRKIMYLDELIYSTNNKTADLITQIKSFYKAEKLIVAESAAPRTNADLEDHFNLIPATKRVGDKLKADWIRELSGWEFIISNTSPNLAKEYQNYIWSDRKSGTPIDGNDHFMDGKLYNYIKSVIGGGGEILSVTSIG